MAGDRETGVMIHRTTAELDAGPIAAEQTFPIGPRTTQAPSTPGPRRSRRSCSSACSRMPHFAPQPEEGATYAEKITADDRRLDWSAPAQEIVDRVRALSPHIGARAELEGRPAIVWRARVEDGRAVPVEVQPEGKRR